LEDLNFFQTFSKEVSKIRVISLQKKVFQRPSFVRSFENLAPDFFRAKAMTFCPEDWLGD